MGQIEQQVRRVQRRLWINRWFQAATFALAIAGGLYAVAVLVQRLFDLPWSMLWVGAVTGCVALTVSVVWTVVTREDRIAAATQLDAAAGLRERLSSAYYCTGVEDPFAQAVVADAERISGSLSVRRHIRFTFPKPLPWATFSIVLAALMFLITPGLLKETEAGQEGAQDELVQKTKAAVKKQLEKVQELAENNPALADFKDDFRNLDKQAGGMLKRPTDIRHEAVKKIDKLADALKKKQSELKYDKAKDMRRMMRRLQSPKSNTGATKKLEQALQKGDFKTAKEELAKLQEQLATLKSDEDKEFAKKIGAQLEKLAKKLEQLQIDEKLAQKLAQAGVKKEDIERALESLSKKDLDRIRKQLEKQGLDQKQINKMMQQLQRQQQALGQTQKLANSLKKAASGCKACKSGDAAAGLSQAAGQLSEAEALESERAEMEATLAELQNARNEIDGCSACKGTGKQNGRPCGKCQGSGNKSGKGMGKLGKGRGGLAPEQQAGMGFKTERAKVHTGRGAIIGQFLVDGEQVKGDVQSTLSEVVAASEHDASDRIRRNRIPRQYQKAVREYFSNVRQLVGELPEAQDDSSGSGGGGDPQDD